MLTLSIFRINLDRAQMKYYLEDPLVVLPVKKETRVSMEKEDGSSFWSS